MSFGWGFYNQKCNTTKWEIRRTLMLVIDLRVDHFDEPCETRMLKRMWQITLRAKRLADSHTLNKYQI